MVDEFIDVNFGEKQFMKVWNSYMMDHRFVKINDTRLLACTLTDRHLDNLL